MRPGGRGSRRDEAGTWRGTDPAGGAMKLAKANAPPAGRLLPWVERMRGLRALVWGDFVLDEYWRCLTRRVSREAPVLVLDW